MAAEIAVPSKAPERAAAAAADLTGSWGLGSGEEILQQLHRNLCVKGKKHLMK